MDDAHWQNGRITGEALAHAKAHVGVKQRMRPWNSEATRDAIWHFAAGLGDDNPMWWDEDHARRSRWGGMVAMPSFLYSCQNGGQDAADTRPFGTDSFLPGVLGLWASTRWVWHRPLRLGEQVLLDWELHSITEPRPSSFGGLSVDQVDRNLFSDAEGRPIAEVFRTIKRFERGATRTSSRYAGRPLAKYTEEDRARFAAEYAAEPAMRRGPAPLRAADLRVGERFGPMLKGPLTLTNMIGWIMGWGSGYCQTNRMAYAYLETHPGSRVFNEALGYEDTIEAPHWEPSLAAQGGYPAGYDFGAQRFAWMMHLLTDWAGDNSFLEEFEGRLLRPNLIGDATWLHGEVTATDPEANRVTVRVTAENQLGELTADAVARLSLG